MCSCKNQQSPDHHNPSKPDVRGKQRPTRPAPIVHIGSWAAQQCSESMAVLADKDDWRDAWAEEGIGALLLCRVLNERTAANRALWRPEDDSINSAANAEATGEGAGRIPFTPPGFRRPRQHHHRRFGQTAGRSPQELHRTRHH